MSLKQIDILENTPLDRAKKHFQRLLEPSYLSETRSYTEALREQTLGLALVTTAMGMAEGEYVLVETWIKGQGGGTIVEFFSVFPYVGLSLGLLGLALVAEGTLYAGPDAHEALYKCVSYDDIQCVELGGRAFALKEVQLAVVRKKT